MFIHRHQCLYSLCNNLCRLTHGRFRNLFRHLIGLLWTSDRPVAKATTYTQDNTTQKDEDKHPCLKRDSHPRSQRPSDQGLRLRPRDHWDQRFPLHTPKLYITYTSILLCCLIQLCFKVVLQWSTKLTEKSILFQLIQNPILFSFITVAIFC
jgi:hypothetical protein